MLFLLLAFANLFIVIMKGDNNICYCVPPEKCLDKNITTLDGNNLLDIRLKGDQCENYMDVCCVNPEMSIKGEISVVASSSTKESYRSICGYQNNVGYNTRITDQAHDANFGEIPWMVAVLFKKDSKVVYRCGGSLIHPQVVLTAAHCVEDQSTQWLVRAGETNTKDDNEPLPYQQRPVYSIAQHPDYHPSSLKNDIALLVLDSPFELADNVGTVCIPALEDAPQMGTCLASGWGKNDMKNGKHSFKLKMVQLPLVPRELCQEALRTTRLGSFYHLHRSFVCAGGEARKDTCKGDGGSPLVCETSHSQGKFLQVGIVSWGIGCGEKNIQGVYANVALYRRWIDEQFIDFGLDSGSYVLG